MLFHNNLSAPRGSSDSALFRSSVRFDSVAPAPSPFGPTFGCSFSRLPRRSIVVKSSDSGSALILVLLITALLATITVSFLSTSRVEQIDVRVGGKQPALTEAALA